VDDLGVGTAAELSSTNSAFLFDSAKIAATVCARSHMRVRDRKFKEKN
jgi:hypothetical protein